MGRNLHPKVLVSVFLVSLLSAPFLRAGRTQVTITDAVWDFAQSQLSAQVGDAVGATGDFNKDGYEDVLIGASGYDVDGRVNAGAAFI